MKLIKPSVEIIKQEEYDLNHIFKFIELAGRTCYKSEDKITEDSAKEFVDRMIRSGHGAMLEHGTVYLVFHVKDPSVVSEDEYHNQQALFNKLIDKYITNKYSIVKVNHYCDTAFITTNYRVLVENEWLDDLKYLCKPTSFHEKRTTVKFICDRAVANEFVRHRVFSFAQESTRYCNYSKAKFNSELTFIIPCWLKWDEQTIHQGDFEKSGSGSEDSGLYINSLLNSEQCYKYLIKEGWIAQEARNILPLSLKTELIMTGFDSDWQHFFELRCAPNAHPQAKELADMLKDKFNKYLTEEEEKAKYSIW